MKHERWKQIEQLYHASLERDSGARESFLAQACEGDEELRREVEELLRYDGAAESFIKGNALAFEARRLEPEELSQTARQLLPGQNIGAYKILALLAAGGMGVVYRARDERLRRDVAIKVLPPSLANDADRLRRFEQEAHATSALNHPNILTIYDIGAHEDAPFIVSELLEGEELRAQLESGALPVRRALEYAQQITAGLAAAHEKGIVHRDLKPEKSSFGQIAVSPDGRYLAFTAASGGNVQLWVRPLDSIEAKALAGTQGANLPFWSPDSRFIGFFADGRLKKIEVSGGLVQPLCNVPVIPLGGAWSRDGVILFSQVGSGLLRISATGGDVTQVTTRDRSRQELFHRYPTFLPDGWHFLYSIASGQKGTRGIYLGSLDGKVRRRLLDDLTPIKYMAAVPGDREWSGRRYAARSRIATVEVVARIQPGAYLP